MNVLPKKGCFKKLKSYAEPPETISEQTYLRITEVVILLSKLLKQVQNDSGSAF